MREHIAFTTEGLRRLVPRSKGDAAGKGVSMGIARGSRAETFPMRALKAWLEMSDCRFGPMFRLVLRWLRQPGIPVVLRSLTTQIVKALMTASLRYVRAGQTLR